MPPPEHGAVMSLPYRTVWVAGMPRCGSMWCFNVARRLLGAAGYSVRPAQVPRTAEAMYQAGLDGLGDGSGGVTVVKVHDALPANLPNTRIIAPVRDPRDAMVSYMRFTDAGFEDALDAAKGWVEMCDHYAAMPTELCWRPAYGEIVAAPDKVTDAMAEFLALALDASDRAAISAEFDKRAVAERIRKAETRLEAAAGAPGAPGSPDRDAMVIAESGQIRAFDADTGFQSSHVSDYRDGTWRAQFDDAQIARLDAFLGRWLASNGFD